MESTTETLVVFPAELPADFGFLLVGVVVSSALLLSLLAMGYTTNYSWQALLLLFTLSVRVCSQEPSSTHARSLSFLQPS